MRVRVNLTPIVLNKCPIGAVDSLLRVVHGVDIDWLGRHALWVWNIWHLLLRLGGGDDVESLVFVFDEGVVFILHAFLEKDVHCVLESVGVVLVFHILSLAHEFVICLVLNVGLVTV